jgi:hypothetical protein
MITILGDFRAIFLRQNLRFSSKMLWSLFCIEFLRLSEYSQTQSPIWFYIFSAKIFFNHNIDPWYQGKRGWVGAVSLQMPRKWLNFTT